MQQILIEDNNALNFKCYVKLFLWQCIKTYILPYLLTVINTQKDGKRRAAHKIPITEQKEKLSPPTIIMYRNETRKFSKMFSER